ncbi:hypothetical protein COP2_041937 [Malus domestica]
MNEAIVKLTKTVEEKDMQIVTLMSRLEWQHDREADSDPKKNQHDEESGEEEAYHIDKARWKQKPESGAILMGSFSIQQLQDIITNTIKAQYGGTLKDALMYSKLYTKRIDSLRMSTRYQPPKFMQFEGKGNPKQHIAYFVETCNNSGTERDYLIKQFIHSFKENVFDWYTDLEPESINNWKQLE